MKKLALVIFVAAQVWAQETKSEIVRLQHQKATVIWNLISPMMTPSTRGAYDNDLRTITLSGSKEVVDMLISNIHRLDVLPQQANIELTFHMLAPAEMDGPIPAELAGVIKQLKATLPTKGYQVVESAIHRAVEGNYERSLSTLNGTLGRDNGAPVTYQISFRELGLNGEGANRQVILRGLSLQTSYAPRPAALNEKLDYARHYMTTDVTINNGQRVVVGKTTAGPSRESLFLVVSAKIIE